MSTGVPTAKPFPPAASAPPDALERITGILPGIRQGARLEVEGEYRIHQAHGRQFAVGRHRFIQPTSKEGLIGFLGSGLLKGVGEATARQVVGKFGKRTLEVLDSEPERLAETEGHFPPQGPCDRRPLAGGGRRTGIGGLPAAFGGVPDPGAPHSPGVRGQRSPGPEAQSLSPDPDAGDRVPAGRSDGPVRRDQAQRSQPPPDSPAVCVGRADHPRRPRVPAGTRARRGSPETGGTTGHAGRGAGPTGTLDPGRRRHGDRSSRPRALATPNRLDCPARGCGPQ